MTMNYEKHKELISILNACAIECNRCTIACLEEENINMLEKCIKLDIDCAEMCHLAVSFLARDSEHTEHILPECAELCESCAKECEMHKDLDHCKVCAEACRKCAEACLQVA